MKISLHSEERVANSAPTARLRGFAVRISQRGCAPLALARTRMFLSLEKL